MTTTRHFHARMRQRGITADMIVSTLRNPSAMYLDKRGTWVVLRGGLKLVLSADRRRLITCAWVPLS